MSCATCHDPLRVHGPPNALAVQVGGRFQDQAGLRASPSLRYLERQPAFSAGAVPARDARGGFTADGRFDDLAAQAHQPIFGTHEMDNPDADQLVRKLRAGKSAALFAQVYGTQQDTATAVAQIQQALAAFQRESPGFHPYDSKFDQVRAGRETFSAAEQRGLAVFQDPARGNCAACHPAQSPDGQPPLFTTFGYAALGLPRNAAIPANADPGHVDLGLCGPERTDITDPATCGQFRIPSLRNVAQRPVFFHNGVITSLADALRFLNTRDTRPQDWYPGEPFDDLPAAVRANVYRGAPFGGRRAGDAPAMREAELADLACFLGTLSDGHVAGTPPAAGCGD